MHSKITLGYAILRHCPLGSLGGKTINTLRNPNCSRWRISLRRLRLCLTAPLSSELWRGFPVPHLWQGSLCLASLQRSQLCPELLSPPRPYRKKDRWCEGARLNRNLRLFVVQGKWLLDGRGAYRGVPPRVPPPTVAPRGFGLA